MGIKNTVLNIVNKFLFSLIAFILITLFFLFSNRKTVFADNANCTIASIDPSPLTTNSQIVTLIINSKNLGRNLGPYTAHLINTTGYDFAIRTGQLSGYYQLNTDNNFNIRLDRLNAIGILNSSQQDSLSNYFQEGKYTIQIFSKDTFECSVDFDVKPGLEDRCRILIKNSADQFTTANSIEVSIQNLLSIDNSKEYNLILKDNNIDKEISSWKLPNSFTKPINQDISIGKLPVGNNYRALVDLATPDSYNGIINHSTACFTDFPIVPEGQTIDKSSIRDDSSRFLMPQLHLPCGNLKVCLTAIGTIDVSSPTAFIGKLFGIILSLAGVGAVGLFVYAGYLFMTSGGDKQKVQAARETITSAISGLLFIIFSIFILEFIGVDLLQIFGR